MTSVPARELACVRDPERAGVLLHPLRARILREAREPASASEIAARLALPRQRVNYHVRTLAESGFLHPAERLRRRGLVEQRYVASSRSWLLAPELLGPLAPDPEQLRDRFSASYLLALCGRAQSELAAARGEAAARERKLPVLALETELRFTSAAQRTAFARALEEAVAGVVARHSAPSLRAGGGAAPGRPYRLVLGAYPIPLSTEP